MATIKFYGHLKQYGDKYTIHAETAAEALNCLYTQIQGLKQAIMQGHFRVRINKKDLSENTLQFGMQSLLPKSAVIHLVPVVAGAKSSGLFQVILGAALVGVGFAFLGGVGAIEGLSVIAAGAGLMLGGVAQMLTKIPSTSNSSEVTKKSTSFSSLSNAIAQGAPIPLIYGQMMVGSKVLSQGIETMDTE